MLVPEPTRNYCGYATQILPFGRMTVVESAVKVPSVYILSSEPHGGVLYVGVTGDLARRLQQHKQGLIEGFTKQYGVHRLVYYEAHATMEEAIKREKRLKNWHRAWKFRLIAQMNPEWLDLYDETSGAILDGPADIARNPRDFPDSDAT